MYPSLASVRPASFWVPLVGWWCVTPGPLQSFLLWAETQCFESTVFRTKGLTPYLSRHYELSSMLALVSTSFLTKYITREKIYFCYLLENSWENVHLHCLSYNVCLFMSLYNNLDNLWSYYFLLIKFKWSCKLEAKANTPYMLFHIIIAWDNIQLGFNFKNWVSLQEI